MQEVLPRIYIGDYASSQSVAELQRNKVRHVISAMRQECPVVEGTTQHRVEIDDTNTTNIISHFDVVNDFIRSALAESDDGAVLVHCQAGISRSSTLVAAYLMKDRSVDVDEALEIVRRVRSQAEPIDFFLHQLEMYERCNCEWNPVKYSEQRRFLMNFAQSQIMDGSSPSIVLAYYPSPAPSPKERSEFGIGMTPIIPPATRTRRTSNSSADLSRMADSAVAQTPPSSSPFTRKRLTPRSGQKGPSAPSFNRSQTKTNVERIGSKASVAVTGRRIRCKICRRELAAREHVLEHEPGKGQQAFAPHRRDMAAYRQEIEQRKKDGAPPNFKRTISERTFESSPSSSSSSSAARSNAAPPSSGGGGLPNLAGLRVSKPPALRVAMPPIPQAVQVGSSGAPEQSPSRPLVSTTTLQSVPDVSSEDHDQAVESESIPDKVDGEDEPRSAANEKEEDYECEGEEEEEDAPLLRSKLCSSYFTEPLSWMSPTLEKGELAGRIVCPNPKCGSKLGSFDWAGLQCSCGAWVCPGFALNVSKCDEVIGAPIMPTSEVAA